MGLRTIINAGNARIPRSGCQMAMPSYASMRAVRDARLAYLTTYPLEKAGISASVLSGQDGNHGQTGGWGTPDRNLICGHDTVASGLVPTHAPIRDVRVGRRRRPVSRHQPSGWNPLHVLTVLVRRADQESAHGLGSRGPRNPITGMLVTGDVDLPDEELMANRTSIAVERAAHPFDGDYYRERSARWDRVVTPLLSAGNWGGAGAHLRGNIEGFVNAASEQKWLEVHGGNHFRALYFGNYGVELQKRFFGHFLRDEESWRTQPRVSLQVRHADGRFVSRGESEWPLARTQWTKLYSTPPSASLKWKKPRRSERATYEAMGVGLTLVTEKLAKQIEITGPISCKLWLSSSTVDADLFLVLRLFDPNGSEVLFQGANDPKRNYHGLAKSLASKAGHG